MIMTIQETIDHAIGLITNFFNKFKYLNAFCLLIKNDKITCVPLSFSNDIQKDIMSAGIKELVKRSDPDTVVYACEAWSIHASKEEDLDMMIRPSERQDRVEIVMIQIEFRTGEKFGCSADIIRTESSARLGDFKIMDAKYSMGRFADFYPVAEKDKN
jgi:hypothetical protein